jgi:hypothetical protein
LARSYRRLFVALLCAASVAGGFAITSASAAATDIEAITSTASEFASDTVSNLNQPNDNLTCTAPVANGAAVVQATNAVVAEVFGEDAAVARIECASLTPSQRYTLSGTLYIQAYYSGGWHNVASSGLTTTGSTEGAAVLVLHAIGTYAPPSAALGAYHRAYAVITSSTGRLYRVLSPTVWYMNN